jgi:hypothetical protein
MSTERFVQVETGLRRSKLVDRLNNDLDVHPAIIVGCLVLLWSEALDARTRGDLSERSDRWIEDAAGWPGVPGVFAAAIRKHHLDEHGVIRDFEEKYGKLDVQRGKAAQIKRNQRDRARTVPEMSTGQTEDRPQIPSISQSVSPDVALGEGEPERERAGDHPAIALVRERFGEHADWPIGLVRGSQRPDYVAAALVAHLDGMHGPAYAPEVIALAAQEWGASNDSAEGFKPRLFAGYVRRAEGTIKMAESRRQQQNETRHIRAEVAVQEEDRDAEKRISREIESFRAEQPERFAELWRIAEGKVPEKWQGVFREPMVRNELIQLIRKEGARAAS